MEDAHGKQPMLVIRAVSATLWLMPLAFALGILVLAGGWRVLAIHAPAFSNFAPLMALTFCGAVYIREKRMWLVPFLALMASDVYLDHYYATVYGEHWTWPSAAIRAICFALAIPLGRFVAAHKNWHTLFTGALTASFFFFLVTNTDAWLRDPYYI